MDATFTQEILVNYLYGQLTESEMEAVRNELTSDQQLAEAFEMLKETMIALENDEKLLPSESSIKIIMNHSERTSKENQAVVF
jgi:DNA-binding XRE family transcriptional regulator